MGHIIKNILGYAVVILIMIWLGNVIPYFGIILLGCLLLLYAYGLITD